jgi:hypothetical protein
VEELKFTVSEGDFPTAETFVCTSMSKDTKSGDVITWCSLPRKRFLESCQIQFEKPIAFCFDHSAVIHDQLSVSIKTEFRTEPPAPGTEDQSLLGIFDLGKIPHGKPHVVSVQLSPKNASLRDMQGVATVSITRISCEKTDIPFKVEKLQDCFSKIDSASGWLTGFPKASCCDLIPTLSHLLFDATQQAKAFANALQSLGVKDRQMQRQIQQVLDYQLPAQISVTVRGPKSTEQSGANWLLNPDKRKHLCRDWETFHKVRKCCCVQPMCQCCFVF